MKQNMYMANSSNSTHTHQSPRMLCTPYTCLHLPKPVHTVHATCMHAPIDPSPCILCTPHACMHPSTQARACCARHMHAPIDPNPCMLCTPHACTHLPKPVHTVHATCMHPSTQRHMHACTHLPKPVHAVHATCMHPLIQARACCARHMHPPTRGPQDSGLISQGTLSPLRDPVAPSQVSGGLPVEQLRVASAITQCAPPPDRLQASRAPQGSRAPGAPGAPQGPRGSNGHPRSPWGMGSPCPQ